MTDLPECLVCPARALYYQLMQALASSREKMPGLRLQAVAILTEEFGDKSVSELATDELKWLNGKLLKLFRERRVEGFAVEPVAASCSDRSSKE